MKISWQPKLLEHAIAGIGPCYSIRFKPPRNQNITMSDEFAEILFALKEFIAHVRQMLFKMIDNGTP
jgi:hypothetical protein